jgi:hypothetical protein
LQPTISVNLDLTDATRKDGVLDMTKIKLMVDGVDVTGKATVLGTMDYPQSHATITYVPDQPLAAGKHTASIAVATPAGDQTYQWTFETAAIPCQ